MNLSGIMRTLCPLSQYPPRLRVSPSVLFLSHRFVSSHRPRDLYSVLDVKSTAEQKEIKDSFYKLSKEHHPDVNKEAGAQRRFREILEAYEVLGSPHKRKEYDIQMGIRPVSSAPDGGTSQFHGYPGTYGFRKGQRQRSAGMKGEFRNGFFYDEDGPQEQRNIQYDLDPEKMEKIWKRYKSRWERLEEIEKEKNLEEKKIKFRTRMEEKRERMLNNQMSKEEREEFMFRIRMHRPDAAEDFHVNKSDINEPRKDPDQSESDPKENKNKEAMDKQTRDILKNQFGMSDEELDRLDIGADPRKNVSRKNLGRRKLHDDMQQDPFFAGIDPTRDATSWTEYLNRSMKESEEKMEQLKKDSLDSSKISEKYHINDKDRKSVV